MKTIQKFTFNAVIAATLLSLGAGAGAIGGAVLTNGSGLGTVGGAAVGGIIGHEVSKPNNRR